MPLFEITELYAVYRTYQERVDARDADEAILIFSDLVNHDLFRDQGWQDSWDFITVKAELADEDEETGSQVPDTA
jgi:hypothetical protein